MLRSTFILSIVDAFHCLAVNADSHAGMVDGAGKAVHPLTPTGKALATGVATSPGVLSSHTDLALSAEPPMIIDTILSAAS